ncbi:hypothetical protein, partial [Klebsiella pneumoniae]|uniref:hypothetical protein n=1 Tax=Klebsiella pneumoniae TaxID=573 RepID=UPI001CC1C334
MINGNGGKCKSTANKYALSATDLPGEHLALMESGNTLIHSAGIRRCCQLTDLEYDGVFEVLQWLLFISAVPPVQ